MDMMARPIGRHWWALLIRGIVAILFGIGALIWPGITLIVLVSLFGAFALVDGIFSVIAAIGERGHDHWGWLLVGGLIGIIIGIITFFWPHITVLILLNIIAIWAILTGIYAIVLGILWIIRAFRFRSLVHAY